MDELMYEPLKYYESAAHEKHAKCSMEYFDELVAKSGMDVEENHKTVKAYRDELANIDKLSSRLSKFSGLRVFLILASIAGIIAAIMGIVQLTDGNVWPAGILMLLIGIAVAAVCIYFWFAKVNPIIKDANAVLEAQKQKAADLLAQAEAQMASLNSLFDDTDTYKVFEKTIPEFKFNTAFSPKHEDLLASQNDFVNVMDIESSVVNTLAGSFCGNPFLYYRYNQHEMGTQDYQGSLYIEWTETYRDSDGNLRTRDCSQTLYATVTKPKPYYYVCTNLAYGCQAAPDLNFTRTPTHCETLSEKELKKKIAKGEKELQKKARKATKEGGNFQEMANSEFEVLYGAEDRDNEVQFRLMFTPLAQRNTVSLLRNTVGYGDDFHVVKRRRCTTISSEHSQNWNMNTTAEHYKSYDLETARTNFLNFNHEFFRSVYFDFAPLMSVPAYLDSPVPSMEDPKYDRNYTDYEHEALANGIGQAAFSADGTITDTILKTSFISREDDVDIVQVDAYSYTGEERIDYVPVLGGDKRYHNVPVHWIEYIPLLKTSNIAVKAYNMSEREFRDSDVKFPNNGAYMHGLLAYLLDN